MIDHIGINVSDVARSKKFYEAALAPLGYKARMEFPEGAGFGDERTVFWIDELCVSTPDSPAAQGKLTGRCHLAFQARDQAMVQRAHQAGLSAGGVDNGAPGPRPYHPGYFAAFLLDPDGNNIEVVHHGEAKRSAASVKIAF